jgi:hypothetical protein
LLKKKKNTVSRPEKEKQDIRFKDSNHFENGIQSFKLQCDEDTHVYVCSDRENKLVRF